LIGIHLKQQRISGVVPPLPFGPILCALIDSLPETVCNYLTMVPVSA